MLAKIIRFLTNCYQLMIVLAFFSSILFYLCYVILNVVAFFNASAAGVDTGIVLGIIMASIIVATVTEAIFLVILGGAAILIDIRNILNIEGFENARTN